MESARSLWDAILREQEQEIGSRGLEQDSRDAEYALRMSVYHGSTPGSSIYKKRPGQ